MKKPCRRVRARSQMARAASLILRLFDLSPGKGWGRSVPGFVAASHPVNTGCPPGTPLHSCEQISCFHQLDQKIAHQISEL